MLTKAVSVPLRGLWFLSTALTSSSHGHLFSFRPLAGIMVLIYRRTRALKHYSVERFRPLAGIMVLILNSFMDEQETGVHCFRPLAGIMVLIKGGINMLEERLQEFPSPCGDYGSYPI